MKKTYLLAAMALVLFACKDKEEPVQPDPTPVLPILEEVDGAYFKNPIAWQGVFVEISNAMQKTLSADAKSPALWAETTYPTYSYSPMDGTWPVTVTINYGTTPVVGVDGLEHTGIMSIRATGMFETPGSVITPTLNQYKVFGTILSGSQTITNTGKNERNHMVYRVEVKDGVIGASKEFVYSENTMREMLSGLDEFGLLLPDLQSHQYSISGWMKCASTVDTIPGCEIHISDEDPMVIAHGDLYPTSGLLHIELDKAVEMNLNSQATGQGLSLTTVSVKELTLQFTGLVADGRYSATATVPIKMPGIKISVTLYFEMDENGIIPESISYVYNK